MVVGWGAFVKKANNSSAGTLKHEHFVHQYNPSKYGAGHGNPNDTHNRETALAQFNDPSYRTSSYTPASLSYFDSNIDPTLLSLFHYPYSTLELHPGG